MRERFQGRTVLVTGAVGDLSKAMAHALAAEGRGGGDHRTEKKGRDLAEAVGRGAIVARLDVADEAFRAAAIETAEAQHGPLSVLINNAAYLAVGGVALVAHSPLMRCMASGRRALWTGMVSAAVWISARSSGGSVSP